MEYLKPYFDVQIILIWLKDLRDNCILFLIFTNPSAQAGYDIGSIFKRSLTGLNSEFSFSKTSCRTKVGEISLPYYLPIAGGRIIGFKPLPRVLALREMQSVSSRIWTRVTVSISYDDNHYTTRTSCILFLLRIDTWSSYCLPDTGMMVRVPANAPGDLGSIHQRLKRWYLMPACLTLSFIRHWSRVK